MPVYGALADGENCQGVATDDLGECAVDPVRSTIGVNRFVGFDHTLAVILICLAAAIFVAFLCAKSNATPQQTDRQQHDEPVQGTEHHARRHMLARRSAREGSGADGRIDGSMVSEYSSLDELPPPPAGEDLLDMAPPGQSATIPIEREANIGARTIPMQQSVATKSASNDSDMQREALGALLTETGTIEANSGSPPESGRVGRGAAPGSKPLSDDFETPRLPVHSLATSSADASGGHRAAANRRSSQPQAEHQVESPAVRGGGDKRDEEEPQPLVAIVVASSEAPTQLGPASDRAGPGLAAAPDGCGVGQERTHQTRPAPDQGPGSNTQDASTPIPTEGQLPVPRAASAGDLQIRIVPDPRGPSQVTRSPSTSGRGLGLRGLLGPPSGAMPPRAVQRFRRNRLIPSSAHDAGSRLSEGPSGEVGHSEVDVEAPSQPDRRAQEHDGQEASAHSLGRSAGQDLDDEGAGKDSSSKLHGSASAGGIFRLHPGRRFSSMDVGDGDSTAPDFRVGGMSQDDAGASVDPSVASGSSPTRHLHQRGTHGFGSAPLPTPSPLRRGGSPTKVRDPPIRLAAALEGGDMNEDAGDARGRDRLLSARRSMDSLPDNLGDATQDQYGDVSNDVVGIELSLTGDRDRDVDAQDRGASRVARAGSSEVRTPRSSGEGQHDAKSPRSPRSPRNPDVAGGAAKRRKLRPARRIPTAGEPGPNPAASLDASEAGDAVSGAMGAGLGVDLSPRDRARTLSSAERHAATWSARQAGSPKGAKQRQLQQPQHQQLGSARSNLAGASSDDQHIVRAHSYAASLDALYEEEDGEGDGPAGQQSAVPSPTAGRAGRLRSRGGGGSSSAGQTWNDGGVSRPSRSRGRSTDRWQGDRGTVRLPPATGSMDELPGEEDEDAEEEDGMSGSRRDKSTTGWSRGIDGAGTRTASSTSDNGVERRVQQGLTASGRAGVASSQRRHSRARVALNRPAGTIGESASGSEGTSRSLSRSAGGPPTDTDWLDEHADGTGHPPRSGAAAASENLGAAAGRRPEQHASRPGSSFVPQSRRHRLVRRDAEGGSLHESRGGARVHSQGDAGGHGAREESRMRSMDETSSRAGGSVGSARHVSPRVQPVDDDGAVAGGSEMDMEGELAGREGAHSSNEDLEAGDVGLILGSGSGARLSPLDGEEDGVGDLVSADGINGMGRRAGRSGTGGGVATLRRDNPGASHDSDPTVGSRRGMESEEVPIGRVGQYGSSYEHALQRPPDGRGQTVPVEGSRGSEGGHAVEVSSSHRGTQDAAIVSAGEAVDPPPVPAAAQQHSITATDAVGDVGEEGQGNDQGGGSAGSRVPALNFGALQ